jgi:hypothetical protein
MLTSGRFKAPPPKPRTWSERRPGRVHAAYGALIAWWLAVCGVAVWGMTSPGRSGRQDATSVFWLVFWVVAVLALLVRGWWGGPKAWVYVQFAAFALGLVVLGGMVAFGVLAVVTGFDVSGLVYFAPGLASGALLVAAGRLLSSEDVRHWYGA